MLRHAPSRALPASARECAGTVDCTLTAAPRKRGSRALTFAQEVAFFCVAAALALAAEAVVVLRLTAVIE